MIDWTIVFSSGAVALILGICGIAFKFLTDRQATQAGERAVVISDRAAFLVSVLDEVKSLRLDADTAGAESRKLWEDMKQVKNDLLECLTARQEMARQVIDLQRRIADLEKSAASPPLS